MRITFALLLIAIIPFCFAQTSAPTAAPQPTYQELETNDLHVLQYALLLERLEAYFYTTFQAQFSAANFTAAGLSATDYQYFDLIRNHEQAHVALLSSVVEDAGTCKYNFSIVTDVATYIAVASVLENTGVLAYNGVIPSIYDKDLLLVAEVIATVEARHASFLYNLNNEIPFPYAFDFAGTPPTVAELVFGPGGFAECNFTTEFELPVEYVVQPIANASDSSQPTPQTLSENDILVLQYALFLEHLEASFYTYVTNNYNSSFNTTERTYINLIKNHEIAHVDTLTSVINYLGATPGPACNSYNFSNANSRANIIEIASVLENTGVYAYDGAIPYIYNNALKQAATTIATVEARHASYLNTLGGTSQGPVRGGASLDDGAYDNAFNFSVIVNIVLGSGLIANCDNALGYVQPFQLLVVKPYTNATTPTSSPTVSPTTGTAAPTRSPTSSPTTGTVAPTTGTRAPTSSPTASPTTGTRAPTPSGNTTTSGATSGTRAPTAAPSTSGAASVVASFALVAIVALVAF